MQLFFKDLLGARNSAAVLEFLEKKKIEDVLMKRLLLNTKIFRKK